MKNLDYGVIGNCQSAALVSKRGSIEWLCLPHFGSPSLFAKLLDTKIGGSFEVLTGDDYHTSQKYISSTNLLLTHFSNGDDAFEVIDFMPRYINDRHERYSPPDLIRYIRYISGTPRLRIKFDPRLDYARSETVTEVRSEYIKSFSRTGPYDSVYLYTSLDREKVSDSSEVTIEKDHFMLLSYNQKLLSQTTERCYLKMERTKVYWLNWTEKTRRFSEYQEEIDRSALLLKMLSYDRSGALIAAVTTSLPETLNGVRNWDYRYCWLRDASMVIKVMSSLGHLNVARRFMKFIIDIIPVKNEKIQILYGIHGEKKLKESTLTHLEGYEGSRPVRIGNAAYMQKQNDIYGVLMDVIYQQFMIFDIGLDFSEDLWTITRSVVKTVSINWKHPDRGIWELRSNPQHFTFSKVLCWVAIDRAVKIARLLKKDTHADEWTHLRDKIRKNIMLKAWNKEIGAFTQHYGSDDLDASSLLMESYGFIDAMDPKYVSTVKATRENLMREGLMYRYTNHDDFGKPSSSFTICTFWMINALYKTGEKEEARRLFDQVLSHSNHLGLFSEDIDFETKRLLGNFPQAYSHLALIESAALLSGGKLSDDDRIMTAIHMRV
ncbi:MAG: glycoside hydrolase family 15 protein [Bacteroidales bacterium]|nr:glycoside hydrolase family 15 protein [Bacteroidales bacterium]